MGVRYVLNGDKTQEQVLTARLNCDPGHECRQMLETKRAVGKEGGIQYYHLIQSFRPGEISRSWRWRSPQNLRKSICQGMRR